MSVGCKNMTVDNYIWIYIKVFNCKPLERLLIFDWNLSSLKHFSLTDIYVSKSVLLRRFACT